MEKLNLDEYNNFKEYKDIAKYMLTNNTNKNQIASYIKIMQFDDIKNIVKALQFFIDIDKQMTVNIFNNSTGFVYILDYTEVNIPLNAKPVKFNDKNIYPLNKESLYNIIYNKLKDENFREIKADGDIENQVLETVYKYTHKAPHGFYEINDLIISYGTLYDTPIQLVIKNVFVKDNQLYFNGILFYNNINNFIMRAV